MSVPPKSDEDKAAGKSPAETKKPARSRLTRGGKKSPKAATKEMDFSEPPPTPPPAPEPVREAVPPPPPQAEVPVPQVQAGDQGQPPQEQDGGQADGGNGGQYQQHGNGGGGGKWGRRQRGKFRGGGGGGGGKWGGNPNFQPGPKHPPQSAPPKEAVHYGDLPDPARFQNIEAVGQLAEEIAKAKTEPVWLNELFALNLAELTALAKRMEVKFEGAPNRRQLITQIFAAITEQKIPLYDRGFLDQTDRGLWFVVHDDVNYRLYPEDAFLPEIFVKHYGLKRGHAVEVQLQPPQGTDRCPAVVAIRSVMGGKPEDISKVQPFEELVPYYPLKRILLEMPGQKDVSMRMVDIITPIGFGQRGSSSPRRAPARPSSCRTWRTPSRRIRPR
jgi:transcription termination factor Rho